MKTEQRADSSVTPTVSKGRILTAYEFAGLSFEEKLLQLRTSPLSTRMKLIMDDPEPRKLVRALSPQEFYQIIKGVGENDSLPLLASASPSQIAFALDMELWDRWEFCPGKAYEWMEHMLACGEEETFELLTALEPEFLQLFLLEEIKVTGDTGDMAIDAERLADWDHTFDSIYFITFLNSQHSRLVGALLDILFRLDRPFYTDLMEGCRAAIKSEIEELCLQFRNGRLADLGFPEYDQALQIYSPIKPDQYSPSEPKLVLEIDETGSLFIPPGVDEESILRRSLEVSQSESIALELNSLINSALISEHGGLPNEDSMNSIIKRVYGWLNIAVEFLSQNDLKRATEIIKTERLKRLFQLGCGIVTGIASEARALESADYATGKALRGFSASRPKFYRGLDPDHADGYREFEKMADIVRAREFISMIKG